MAKASKKPEAYGYSVEVEHSLGGDYIVQVIVSRKDGKVLSAEEMRAFEQTYPPRKKAGKQAPARKSA